MGKMINDIKYKKKLLNNFLNFQLLREEIQNSSKRYEKMAFPCKKSEIFKLGLRD